MKPKFSRFIILTLLTIHYLSSQDLNLKNKNYICISAGFGANYANFPDIHDYITAITGKKLNKLSSVPEFWATSEIKINKDMSVKVDYTYTLKQYNIEETSTGVPLIYNFTYKAHILTLLLNHLFFQPQEIYIIKLGFGFGFVNGRFLHLLAFSGKEVSYKANGGTLKFETIFSSRLDGKVYVHLSTDAKISLTQEVKDPNGNKLIIRKPFDRDKNLRLNSVGVAIRFGFSYYL